MLNEDFEDFEKQNRRRHITQNHKHKSRDRARKWFKRWALVGRWVFARRAERNVTFGRVPAPTATGYGVAHEKRARRDLFR